MINQIKDKLLREFKNNSFLFDENFSWKGFTNPEDGYVFNGEYKDFFSLMDHVHKYRELNRFEKDPKNVEFEDGTKPTMKELVIDYFCYDPYFKNKWQLVKDKKRTLKQISQGAKVALKNLLNIAKGNNVTKELAKERVINYCNHCDFCKKDGIIKQIGDDQCKSILNMWRGHPIKQLNWICTACGNCPIMCKTVTKTEDLVNNSTKDEMKIYEQKVVKDIKNNKVRSCFIWEEHQKIKEIKDKLNGK